MSYPQASNIPNEAAGATGNSAGAPYSAAGHGPDATTAAQAHEAAGVTGNSAGAPYSAVGHGPGANTVAEAMAYRQSEIAAHDKPIETDPYGNAIIGAAGSGVLGLVSNGPSLMSFAKMAFSVVTTPAKEGGWHLAGEAVKGAGAVAHFIGEAVTGVKENVSDIISNHSAGGDHGPADPNLSSAPDSSAHPGMSSSDLICSDPAISHDPDVSIDTGASHDYAASFDDHNFTPGY